jgi:predicted nucleic acid-binding Zn ribbon protein
VRRIAARPIAGAVERLTAELQPATPLARIQAIWEGALGPALAPHATPLRERDGRLTVFCPDAVWMHELTLMAPELVDRLNAALGDELVHELRCVATPR